MSKTVIIQFSNVAKSFGSVNAVQDFSLEVCSGEIFGLIGPDGAGKTTTMRMACGLLVPTGGNVSLCGFDATHESGKMREHLGYMPQRFSLYPDLTVAENLRFFADLYNVTKMEFVEREHRLMEFSRLAPFRNRRAGQLSGGMKQKLALSCTLIHTPEALILDEPTTGVDPVSREEFWVILRELAKGGQALLVSTPYMDEAMLCDRVALMHKGKLMGMGSPSEVTGLFKRRLVEILGRDLDAARKALSPLSPGLQVNRFGDRLHVIYDSDEQLREIQRVLSKLDVQIRPTSPGIEDTFVALMSEAA